MIHQVPQFQNLGDFLDSSLSLTPHMQSISQSNLPTS